MSDMPNNVESTAPPIQKGQQHLFVELPEKISQLVFAAYDLEDFHKRYCVFSNSPASLLGTFPELLENEMPCRQIDISDIGEKVSCLPVFESAAALRHAILLRFQQGENIVAPSLFGIWHKMTKLADEMGKRGISHCYPEFAFIRSDIGIAPLSISEFVFDEDNLERAKRLQCFKEQQQFAVLKYRTKWDTPYPDGRMPKSKNIGDYTLEDILKYGLQ